MLNTLRIKSLWGARLKGVLAACLLGGSSAAMAANTNLCATDGATLPAPNVPASLRVYGYAPVACDTTTTVTSPGGPVIYATVNEAVTITLYNKLPQATGLLIQGQAMVPDTTGVVAASGTTYAFKVYTFTASKPGTYLYEAGPLANAEHQVAMGLYGALVVRPATLVGQAYDEAATAYDTEAVLVLSEIDPAIGGSSLLLPAKDPTLFDMRTYAPKYFLINGKPYPNTDPIAGAAGSKLLLRYVNAGAKHHSMAVLGLRQVFVAKDGSTLPTLNHNVTAETLAPGQTGDAIVVVPAAGKFAVYDAGLALHNSSTAGFGGMLTFVNAAAAGTDTTGPSTTNLALTPNPSSGTVNVTLSATGNDSATGGSNVVAAEYTIDSAPSATPMTLVVGVAAPARSLTATILPSGLSAGTHSVSVRSQDAVGNWGPSASINLVVAADMVGPTTSGLALTPNPSNGGVSIALSATGSDIATGGSNVVAAEYTIDGGASIAMTLVGAAAPVRSLTATIPPSGLAAGTHTVSVRSRDAAGTLGNWGAPASITLIVDNVGPTTNGVALSPSVSGGVVTGYALSATGNDSASGGSNVTAAEYVIDGGATGIAMNLGGSPSPVRSLTATIPPQGAGVHTVQVRSQDAAGNWGASSTPAITFFVGLPVTSAVSASKNPNNGNLPLSPTQPVVRVSATVVSFASGAEGFIDTTPISTDTTTRGFVFVASDGLWGGATEAVYADIPLTTIASLSQGTHTIFVRGKDAAGSWGNFASTTLTIDKLPPTVSDLTLTPVASNNTAVVVSALATDTATGNSNIGGGEYFIDAAGAAGTGIAMVASAAAPFTVTATIPTASVAGLSPGNHTVYVRAKDSLGNWSAPVSAALLIDRTPPTISNATLSPTTIASGTLSVTLTVTAADLGGAGLAGGQYWIDGSATPPASATPFTGLSPVIPTSALAGGTHTVRVRVQDAATNWSGVSSATLTVVQAVPDTRAITANTNATQTSDTTTGQRVLANDLPSGATGRTAAIASAPARTGGAGAGTITVTCPGSLGTAAAPAIGGNTVCTNGGYRVTLTATGTTNATRQASKRGTYQFTYTETLNGVASTATVTITVN